MQHLSDLPPSPCIKYHNTRDFIVFHKPAGFRFKRLSEKQLGVLEVLSEKLKLPLWSVFPVADQDAGLVLLAKSKEAATLLTVLFKNQPGCITYTNTHFISEIKFHFQEESYHFKTELPHSYRQSDSDLTNLLQDSWQALNHMYQVHPTDCYRLIHHEKNEIQADIYGEVLWVYWYREAAPTEAEQKEVFNFAKFIQKKGCIRHMINRGYGVGGQEAEKLFFEVQTPTEWIAEENDIQYKLKQNAGFSPGLFLDQSENRRWIRHVARDKTVLNLFSYTSGFSVAAALGYAAQVTTVDASPSFLEWSKDNFKLNGLDIEKHEFFCQDTQLFLSGSLKRQRAWDLVICDPPSFGRTKTTMWKIEKDLPDLAETLWKCVARKGMVLFTCNYEKWNLDDIVKNFTHKIKKGSYEIHPLPSFRFDIELPDALHNLTKGFILRKL